VHRKGYGEASFKNIADILRKKCYKSQTPFWFMPDKVHCAHILVKTETEAKAILDRLKKGEKFANIAKEISLCPSGKRGGDLGTFGRGKMVKEFETAAFALKKGETSPIVKTKFGCHVIKRLE
jgi:parvulin-like peptidyl-prolyl isomerase